MTKKAMGRSESALHPDGRRSDQMGFGAEKTP